MAVDDKGVVTAVGEFGLVLRSADAGKTWQALHKGDASLFAMEVSDGGGYAVGQNGAVLHSTDHGASWNEVKVVGRPKLLAGLLLFRLLYYVAPFVPGWRGLAG